VGDGDSGGFAWWVPHDRALRRARALLAIGALVVASYLVAPLICAVVVIRGGVGSLSSRDWAAISGASIVILAAVAGAIALAASRGPTRRVLAWSGARPATDAEVRVLGPPLESFAMARSIASPTVWVTDDGVPNAFAFGRTGMPNVCITRGALALTPHELEALCAHEITALTYPPYTECIATIDLMLFAEWCTSVLWLTPVLLLLSTVVGVPALVAAVVALCFAVLVAVTRLLLFFADRALPKLLDDAALLVDLEAVRVTERPSVLADLLMRMAAGDGRVSTAWPVAHRWFDRRERERVTPHGSRRMAAPALAYRCEHGNGSALRARAAAAVVRAGAVSRRHPRAGVVDVDAPLRAERENPLTRA
jgi:Peptidase family M48